MTSPVKSLADDERFALMKFRRSVQDILQPHHDDYFLLRWLRARKWDPIAAEKMLRESMDWRKKWEVDKLLDWNEPQVLKDYLAHGLSGFDKDGAPVVVVPFGGSDLYGVLHVISRRDMIKATVKLLEKYMGLCQEQYKKYGPAASQLVVIFDMEDFNLRPYMWRPAGEVVITLIQMYEANYPEILKTCFIINAPKVFAFAFSITKKFMNEYTISKIQIYKADPVKWKNAILKLVPKESLPEHFGGTLKDPDGNPRLITKICQGGKVPKEMYKTNEKHNEDFKIIVIKKGDKAKIDLRPQKDGSILSWEFRTEDHDIKFGVFKSNDEGEMSNIIPMQRVAANRMEEVGVLTCEDSSTYSIIFDNSYSLVRSKKVFYNIRMEEPRDDLQEIALQDG